jgi:pseudouridine synthase
VEERVLKIMTRAGIGSRRACDDLIRQGRVKINGRVAQLGAKADPEVDTIEVDGKSLRNAEPLTYVAIYKPLGVLSSPDVSGEDRPWVRDLVPIRGRLYPVGRLDADSEGLVLLTNDGGLTHRLTHPRYEHGKTYRALVEGSPAKGTLDRWRRGGLKLDDKGIAPAKIKVLGSRGKNTWLRIVMHEGRKRQIRRVAEQLGHPVLKLKRTHIASLALGDLKPGEWRRLSSQELRDLKRVAEKGKRSRQRR